MPLPPELSPDLRKLLVGDPWAGVPATVPPQVIDGRSVALRLLRRYLAELTFFRAGGVDVRGNPLAPVPFKVPIANIHNGWPDYEVELQFPSVVFLHSPGTTETIGLANYVQEETANKYAPGTVVVWMGDYVENVGLEIWANKRSELRSILAGVEVALSPTELMAGLRFRMPDYYDQIVTFIVGDRQEFDEPDSARNRRRGRIDVEVRFTKVALIGTRQLLMPSVIVMVDVDPATGRAIMREEVGAEDADPCDDPCT